MKRNLVQRLEIKLWKFPGKQDKNSKRWNPQERKSEDQPRRSSLLSVRLRERAEEMKGVGVVKQYDKLFFN